MLVICNGMMRAGSTLQYNLVKAVLSARSRDVIPHGFFLDPEQIHAHPDLENWIDDQAWHLLKTHRYWSDDRLAPQVRRCYIYRDIRDVAASAMRKFAITSSELFGIVDEAVSLDGQIKSDPNVLVQRYEDVIADPGRACCVLAEYFGININAHEGRAISEACIQRTTATERQFSFLRRLRHDLAQKRALLTKSAVEALPVALRRYLSQVSVIKKLNHTVTQPKPAVDADTLIHPDHFSKWRGRPGAWLEFFDYQQQSTVQNRYKDWLHDNGYPIVDLP